MNVVDTIYRELFPKAYATRMKAKAVGDAYRSYDSASKSRRTDGWVSTGASVNAENRNSLATLRARSRELERNNPYAKKAIQILSTNIVGTGIRPAPKVQGKRQSKVIKDLWTEWAETSQCDYYGQVNFYGLQSLVMKALPRDGEVIIRIHRMRSSETGNVPIKLQLLEADYIASWKEYPYLEKTNGWTIQGIEFDERGRRVAYWLYESHPGDTFRRNIVPVRIPAEEVIHIYKIERPGQVRGVPEGVSSMLRLRDLDDYEDAQLMKQKVAACFAAFVTNDPNMDNPLGSTSESENNERIEPGIIEYLPPGKEVTFSNPPSVDGYSDYMKVMLRAIAAGYGVTYESLTGDLSNVNFSSGRMGWLEFHRNIVQWQQHVLIPMFCDKVWKAFIDAAYVNMKISDDKITSAWTAPRREMIDPSKETKAQNEAIQGGLKSWQEVARENGYEPDELLEQLKNDKTSFDAMGIILSCDYSKNPQVMMALNQAIENTKPKTEPKPTNTKTTA